MFSQPKVAIGDLLLIDLIELRLLSKHEQQFLPPIPLQTLGYVLRGGFRHGWSKEASSQGFRSPSKMAPIIFMLLTPLRSLSTLLSWMFISVRTFFMH
jgi:hypothetical protein